MSKGKCKRKQQRAQQRAQEQANQTKLLDQIEVPEKSEATGSAYRTDENAKDNNPLGRELMGWIREKIEKSSFTDWCLVFFTAVLAGASIYQFMIMNGQLTEMRNARKGEIRSQVRIRVNDPPAATDLEEMKEITFTKTMENVGRSPATRIYIQTAVEVVRSNETPVFNFAGKTALVSMGSLFPGDIQKFPISWFRPNGTIAQLTPEEKQDLKTGNSYSIVYGIVAYTDEFGPHWSQFCEWQNFSPGTFQAKPCTDYNQYGDDQKAYSLIMSHIGNP